MIGQSRKSVAMEPPRLNLRRSENSMIRVAVLGAGRIGKIHANNVALNPRCKLVAIADPIEAAAMSLADSLGCESSASAGATIARNDIDAIVIGTPTDTHIDFTLEGARRGMAVLCEKPIDLDIRKADAAVAEIEKLKAKVMIAFNRRFDPSSAALKRAIDNGAVGTVHQVVITSRDPSPPPPTYTASGGIFRDMTIHDFDMARFLLGEEPVAVSAHASVLVDKKIGAAGDFDSVSVILETASGKQAVISNSRRATYGYDQRIEVHGSKGMVAAENQRPVSIELANEKGYTRPPLHDFFMTRYLDAYAIEIAAFIAAAT